MCYICALFAIFRRPAAPRGRSSRLKPNDKHIKFPVMNKTDLVNEIAAKAQLNKVDAKKALDATLESIEQALANDDKVQLIGSESIKRRVHLRRRFFFANFAF